MSPKFRQYIQQWMKFFEIRRYWYISLLFFLVFLDSCVSYWKFGLPPLNESMNFAPGALGVAFIFMFIAFIATKRLRDRFPVSNWTKFCILWVGSTLILFTNFFWLVHPDSWQHLFFICAFWLVCSSAALNVDHIMFGAIFACGGIYSKQLLHEFAYKQLNKSMPEIVLKKMKEFQLSKCSICAEDLDDSVCVLYCGHSYHHQCIRQWELITKWSVNMKCILCQRQYTWRQKWYVLFSSVLNAK